MLSGFAAYKSGVSEAVVEPTKIEELDLAKYKGLKRKLKLRANWPRF